MKRSNTSEHVKAVTRVGRGHFAPGTSGNPNGRPKVAAEIREIAREHGPWAITRLVQLSRSGDEMVSLHACRVLLDRGYGRPEQAIAIAALPAFAGEVTVSDPIESARVYERVIAGTLLPDAVRLIASAGDAK